MVIGLTDRQWRNLVKVTGTAEAMDALAGALGLDLSEEGNRYRARHAITEALAPWFAARRVAEFASLRQGRRHLVGVPQPAPRRAEDPDLSEDNPMFRTLEQPGLGAYPVPGDGEIASLFDAGIVLQAPKAEARMAS
jgi:2-methylfumaryl-CoA isomerase